MKICHDFHRKIRDYYLIYTNVVKEMEQMGEIIE